MLHQLRTLQALESVLGEFLLHTGLPLHEIIKAWLALGADHAFTYKVLYARDSLYLSHWIGELSSTIEIKPFDNGSEYEIIGVDGSQIYPDRHYAISCFLVNIGTVFLKYKKDSPSTVAFDSIPYVFSNIMFENGCYDMSRTVVNCVRQELEFRHALLFKTQAEVESICFMDGSLIFWHLLSQPDHIKDKFLPLYVDLLHSFYVQKMPIIGYISMPKSKDLISLLRFAFEQKIIVKNIDLQDKQWEKLVDATLMGVFLPVYHRTTLFHYRGILQSVYPEFSCPYFFYLNTGSEIARIELPAWVARDSKLVDSVATIIVDQCIKGNGYPVVLAESHEQAVVKGADRDWFFYMLSQLLKKTGSNADSFISSKSEKKLRMSI